MASAASDEPPKLDTIDGQAPPPYADLGEVNPTVPETGNTSAAEARPCEINVSYLTHVAVVVPPEEDKHKRVSKVK